MKWTIELPSGSRFTGTTPYSFIKRWSSLKEIERRKTVRKPVQHTQAASFRDSSGQLFVKNEVGKRKYCPVFEAKSENQQPSA